MTVTPLQVAKLAGARRMVTKMLQNNSCLYAEETARQVIDELRKAGWTPPGWHDAEDIPQPTYSTPAGRARAREIFEEARRMSRTTVNPPAEPAHTEEQA